MFAVFFVVIVVVVVVAESKSVFTLKKPHPAGQPTERIRADLHNVKLIKKFTKMMKIVWLCCVLFQCVRLFSFCVRSGDAMKIGKGPFCGGEMHFGSR